MLFCENSPLWSKKERATCEQILPVPGLDREATEPRTPATSVCVPRTEVWGHSLLSVKSSTRVSRNKGLSSTRTGLLWLPLLHSQPLLSVPGKPSKSPSSLQPLLGRAGVQGIPAEVGSPSCWALSLLSEESGPFFLLLLPSASPTAASPRAWHSEVTGGWSHTPRSRRESQGTHTEGTEWPEKDHIKQRHPVSQ